MSVLTANQEKFAARLASQTGLNVNVIRAWTLAEESGSAAAGREAAGNNNWLNVGYFDSGPASFATHFGNPIQAADTTAAFLKGKTLNASSGIRSILSTVGKSAGSQISAIANSGWASSGYNHGANLLGTFKLVTGSPAPNLTQASPSGLKTPEKINETPLTASKTPAPPLYFDPTSGVESASIPTVSLKGSSIALPPLELPQAKSPLTTTTTSKLANEPTAPGPAGKVVKVATPKIIGEPYQGTHAVAFNEKGGSNNWESEDAVDIALPKGTPIYAPTSGVIGSQIGSLGSGGRFAGLRVHLVGDGNELYFAHLSKLAVKAGQHVQAGQVIGYSGEADGVAHLHLASKNGDPGKYA